MPLLALLFLTLLNTLNYLDRYIMAAVLPAVVRHFSLTQEQGGYLVSAFVPGYVIFSPIFGYLGDRFNRPRLMAIGVFLWSLATLLTAVAPNFWLFAAARVMVGIGEASFATIAPGFIKDSIKDPLKLNSALSIFFSAIPVGSALGYVLGGFLAGQYSWQAAFIAGTIPGILLFSFLLRFKESRAGTVECLDLMQGFRAIWGSELLLYAIGGYVLQAMALNGVAAFVSSYGEKIGFKLETIGIYFGIILVAAGSLGTLGGGRLCSWLSRKGSAPISSMLNFVGISALLGAPFLFAAFLQSAHASFLLLCFLAELLIFAGTGPINSVIVLVCPQAYLTLTQGLTILALNLLGSLPAPPLVGKIADHFSLEIGLRSLCLPLIAAGLIWTLGGRLAKLRQK